MIITGTDRRDYLQDKIGKDDFIFGFDGRDYLEDDMRMSGQRPSNDYYYGGSGADRIASMFGSDFLFGQGGIDEFDVWKGGDKRVFVHGGQGFDSLTLWNFDSERATVKIHDHRTVIEQGGTKIVVHDSVEYWEFF